MKAISHDTLCVALALAGWLEPRDAEAEPGTNRRILRPGLLDADDAAGLAAPDKPSGVIESAE